VGLAPSPGGRLEPAGRLSQNEGMSDTTPPRQPYEAPQLISYGPVVELTAGGSGNANEGSVGDPSVKRP
jgi:hypothetical protein